MNHPIRIGIVGAGENTRKMHIPGLRAIAGVEIAGVCNRTPESSQRATGELGIPRAFERWIDLVNDPDIDAVLIGTWPYLHCPVTLAALDAGKHVLTEARMALNAAEARAMYEASRLKPQLIAQVVPAPMSFRVDRTVRRLINEGYIGEILAVEVRDGGKFINPSAPFHWRQDFDLSGYNTMSLGIWYEIVMRWIGPATRVSAMSRTFTTARRDSDGNLRAVRVPEHIDVLAELGCGGQLHMQVSAVTGFDGPARVTLHGSEGTLRFIENKLLGGRRNDAAMKEIAIPDHEAGHWRVEEEFINAIRGRETIKLTDFCSGVKYTEFTEAALRSAAEGRTIVL